MSFDWHALLTSATCVVFATWLSRRRTNKNLPPAVPGLPFLGNALQLVNLSHIHLDDWKNQHGPIYSLNALGNFIVVISSATMASDILDKMSAITSSRPDWIMGSELMSRSNLMAAMKYGDKWRKHRRGIRDALRSSDHFFYIQEHEALLLVRDLASEDVMDEYEPEDKLRRLGASTIWRTVYGGAPLKSSSDESLQEINYLSDCFVKALSPGGGIVDIIPVLNYLPSSLAPFKRYANRVFSRANTFFMNSADDAIKRKVIFPIFGPLVIIKELNKLISKLVFEDPGKLNFCTLLNSQKQNQDLSDEDIAWMCGTIFMGGSETNSTALHYFILAMTLYPHVSSRAREELDAQVGDRPPTFADRDRLPYIDAVVKEVLRWRPVTPAIPHVATEDFIYQGYTIPKGTTILGNLWSITHDPALFDDPDTFKPERFLQSEDQDSRQRLSNVRFDDLAFGYGRRICAGKHVAVNTLFITIASLLWAFDFQKAVDDHGNEITPPEMEFVNNGGTIRPKPFPFKLVLRSAGILEHLPCDMP